MGRTKKETPVHGCVDCNITLTDVSHITKVGYITRCFNCEHKFAEEGLERIEKAEARVRELEGHLADCKKDRDDATQQWAIVKAENMRLKDALTEAHRVSMKYEKLYNKAKKS